MPAVVYILSARLHVFRSLQTLFAFSTEPLTISRSLSNVIGGITTIKSTAHTCRSSPERREPVRCRAPTTAGGAFANPLSFYDNPAAMTEDDSPLPPSFHDAVSGDPHETGITTPPIGNGVVNQSYMTTNALANTVNGALHDKDGMYLTWSSNNKTNDEATDDVTPAVSHTASAETDGCGATPSAIDDVTPAVSFDQHGTTHQTSDDVTPGSGAECKSEEIYDVIPGDISNDFDLKTGRHFVGHDVTTSRDVNVSSRGTRLMDIVQASV